MGVNVEKVLSAARYPPDVFSFQRNDRNIMSEYCLSKRLISLNINSLSFSVGAILDWQPVQCRLQLLVMLAIKGRNTFTFFTVILSCFCYLSCCKFKLEQIFPSNFINPAESILKDIFYTVCQISFNVKIFRHFIINYFLTLSHQL